MIWMKVNKQGKKSAERKDKKGLLKKQRKQRKQRSEFSAHFAGIKANIIHESHEIPNYNALPKMLAAFHMVGSGWTTVRDM
jgi:hypothetical protein